MEKNYNISTIFDVPIITYDGGIRLGKVSDVYVNHDSKTLEGISFHSKRTALEKEGFVSLADIHVMGKDAIIVSSETAAIPLSVELKSHSWRTLKGLKVMTVEGGQLGEITDIHVHKEDGTITRLILNDEKIVAIVTDELTIGSDALMVPIEYASRIQDYQPQNSPIPNFRADVRNAKESVEEVVIKAVKKIEKTVDKVFHKAGVDQENEHPHGRPKSVDEPTKP